MFFVWANQQQLSVPSCRPIKIRNGPLTGENVQSHVTSGMNTQSLHRGGLVFSFLLWACQSCSCKIALNAMRLLSDGTMRRSREGTKSDDGDDEDDDDASSQIPRTKQQEKKKRESLRAK